MKIRISNLLLAIKVFLHFNELNAMNHISGTNIPGTGLRLVRPPEGEPNAEGTFQGRKVFLWIDELGYVDHVYFGNCRIPLTIYWYRHDLLIRHVEVAGHGLIAYISKENELLGLLGPSQIRAENALRPSPMEWYITHWQGTRFMLDVNPHTRTVWRMELYGGNQPGYRAHEPDVVNVAGIQFRTYMDREGQIQGADLHAEYVYHY